MLTIANQAFNISDYSIIQRGVTDLNEPLDEETTRVFFIENPIPEEKNSRPQHEDDTVTEDLSQECLQQIAALEEQFTKVRESLHTIVDGMMNNPSYFSQASSYWGNLSIYEKIGGGLLIAVPTLSAGLIFHIGVLVSISGISSATYLTGGYLLEDHHSCNTDTLTRLRNGMLGITQTFQLAIQALTVISVKFSREVARFRKENTRLVETIQDLEEKTRELTYQVEALASTNTLLQETERNLKNSIHQLEQSTGEKQRLLLQYQNELTQVQSDYKKNSETLLNTQRNLEQTKTSLGLEVSRAKAIAQTLQGTITTLSGAIIADEEQKALFKEKLNNFLDDKEQGFEQISAQMITTQQELSKVKDELAQSEARYEELLKFQEELLSKQKQQIDKQEEQLKRLEKIEIDRSSLMEALSTYGLYSPNAAATQIMRTCLETMNKL